MKNYMFCLLTVCISLFTFGDSTRLVVAQVLPDVVFDLVGHPVEGLEGRRIRQARHGLVDSALCLRALLLRDEQISLPLGLFDLVVQLP